MMKIYYFVQTQLTLRFYTTNEELEEEKFILKGLKRVTVVSSMRGWSETRIRL